MIKEKLLSNEPSRDIELATREYMLVVRSKGCTLGTIEKYKYYLDVWKKWMETRGIIAFDQVDTFLLRQWNADIQETPGWSLATVRLAVNVVRGFFNWCFLEQLCDDLGRVLIAPSTKEKVERTITPEEVVLLLQYCDNSVEGVRDASIIAMLYDTGFRATELCNLTLDRVHLNEKVRHKGKFFIVNYGVVQIKGGDEAEGWFEKETRDLLTTWLEVRSLVAQPMENALFVAIGGNTPGQALTRSGLRGIVKRSGERAGIAGVTPHAFRRGFAIAMDDAGASDNLKAKFGRWRSSAMIRRYTRAQQIGWQFKDFSPMKNLPNEPEG